MIQSIIYIVAGISSYYFWRKYNDKTFVWISLFSLFALIFKIWDFVKVDIYNSPGIGLVDSFLIGIRIILVGLILWISFQPRKKL